MITAIISLNYVHGAQMWLAGWLVCAAAYFLMSLLKKSGRTKCGVKNLLLGFLSAEFVTDALWALIYYSDSGYVNYGVGAVYGLLLWPAALAVSAVLTRGHKDRM